MFVCTHLIGLRITSCMGANLLAPHLIKWYFESNNQTRQKRMREKKSTNVQGIARKRNEKIWTANKLYHYPGTERDRQRKRGRENEQRSNWNKENVYEIPYFSFRFFNVWTENILYSNEKSTRSLMTFFPSRQYKTTNL